MVMTAETAIPVTEQTAIVIPAEATTTERYAAKELQDYLFEIGGVELSVVTDDRGPTTTEICVGETNRFKDAWEKPKLYNDGYWLYTSENKVLHILGDGDRGVLYGVYGALREIWDCEFYAKDVEDIPKRDQLYYPYLVDGQLFSVVSNPAFEFRDNNWVAGMGADIAAKLGYNGFASLYGDEQGGAISYGAGFVHTMHDYVEPDRYFDSHPEYFAMAPDGSRVTGQLCLSNPEVYEIALKKLKQNIALNPRAKIFSVSQCDNYDYCHCPECTAIDREEGSHSGTLIRFVNKLANAIAEEHPDVIIDTLAYQWSRVPCQTPPAENVAIRFCTIEACFSHPLRDCTAISKNFVGRVGDTTMQQDLEGWGKFCDRIYIWDYCTDFAHYLMTFPNLGIMQEDIQYFRDHAAAGIFEEGNYQDASGEFGELRAYLFGKLLWDPDGDYYAWMRNFLKAYYGDGAYEVGRFIQEVSDYVRDNGVHVSIYDSPLQGHLTEDMLRRALAGFNHGIELMEGNAAVQDNIARSRLQILYDLTYMPNAGTSTERVDWMSTYMKDLKRFNITKIKEG